MLLIGSYIYIVPVFDATSYFQGRKVSADEDFSFDKLDAYDRWKGEIPKDAYVGVLHSMSLYTSPVDGGSSMSFNILGIVVLALSR